MAVTNKQLKVRVQLKYDNKANWTTNNPTLLSGEFGFESDTGKYKIGNGVAEWSSLAYVDNVAVTGTTAPNATTAANLKGGSLYLNTSNNDLYVLTNAGETKTWESVVFAQDLKDAIDTNNQKILLNVQLGQPTIPEATETRDAYHLTGVASLDADTKIADTFLRLGVASTTGKTGIATLDSEGHVVSSQLPGYVDDILEVYVIETETRGGETWPKTFSLTDGGAALTPEISKIYVVKSGDFANKSYRWSGTFYSLISETISLGRTSNTAFPGDAGKTLEDYVKYGWTSGTVSYYGLLTRADNIEARLALLKALSNKDTVDTADIDDSAVTEAKIADGAVTANKLATDSVTTAKIVALNVTATKIADSAVETDKIADLAVTEAKIAGTAVSTAKIADSAVTTAKIADANVTVDKLATDSVTTDKIVALNVTTAKIADSAVETAKIADSAVTTAKIADVNVTTAKLADSAVTTDKINDSAVTNAKIDSMVISKLTDSVAGSVAVDGETVVVFNCGSSNSWA